MAAIDVTNAESYYSNHDTGLLVSILLRYPEIGTISCCPLQQSLVLKFLVTKDCAYELLRDKMVEALELFHRIEGRKMRICTIEKQNQEIDMLVITRDLVSITQNEMNLIVELIKTEIGSQLIIDESSLIEDEILLQEEVISHMLAAIRTNGTEKNITALREDGRVLVFNG